MLKNIFPILTVAALVFSFPLTAFGGVGGPLDEYGGRLASYWFCPCSANFVLIIQDVVTGVSYHIYQPGVSRVDLDGGVLVPGLSQLAGLYPTGWCGMPNGDDGCDWYYIPTTIDTPRGVGISALPG